VLVRDEKQLISTRLANSSRGSPQKKLHHDQSNRSTGLSTVHAAEGPIGAFVADQWHALRAADMLDIRDGVRHY
jgi:hypothetical protein